MFLSFGWDIFLYQQFNIQDFDSLFMGCLTPYALVAGIFLNG